MRRFLSRHVAQTLADHLRARLHALGWVDPPVNFGAAPVRVVDAPPRSGEPVEPTTVGVALGPRGALADEELGSGLVSVVWPLALDVYAATESVCVALCDDLVDALDALDALVLRDYTTVPAGVPTDDTVEVSDVGCADPPAAVADTRFWRVVTAEVTCFTLA